MMYNITMARPKRTETEAERKARMAGYVQRWRTNNPDKQKLARQRAYNNRKIKAMNIVGGAVCRNCGCDELHALEFNHINGGGASEYRLSGNRPIMDRLLTDKRNFEGLEVLCRVCNALDFTERKLPEIKGKFTVVWHD